MHHALIVIHFMVLLECETIVFAAELQRISRCYWPVRIGVYVTVHTETYAACKRRSPFANGLKKESVYKWPRQYENRDDARLWKHQSGKATLLRPSVWSEKSLWGVMKLLL